MTDAGALAPFPPAAAGLSVSASAAGGRAAALPTRYLPALDGLRAFAVLLVVASHAAPAHVIPGGFGVTLFFFISGYLLTGQLVDEHFRTGRIDFAGFYLRRMLRLMPAAVVFIAASGLFFLAIGGTLSLSAWASALFYGANYFDIFSGYRPAALPSALGGTVEIAHPFSILWSLAIEEHFYLLWPATLLIAMRVGGWRAAATLLVCLCLFELGWRAVLHGVCHAPGGLCGVTPEIRIYAATDTRFDSLAFGALTAVLVVQRDSGRWLTMLRSRPAQAAALAFLAAGFLVRDETFRDVFRYTIQGVAFMIAIPALLTSATWARRLLEAKPAVFVGRLSYSIYLWHWLAGMIASYAFGHSPLLLVTVYLALTVLLSLLSWYAIEHPMLRLRRWAGSSAAPLAEAAAKPAGRAGHEPCA